MLYDNAQRVRPGTDDKILTARNGLMLATIAEAARALDESVLQNIYLVLATRSAEFLLDDCGRSVGSNEAGIIERSAAAGWQGLGVQDAGH